MMVHKMAIESENDKKHYQLRWLIDFALGKVQKVQPTFALHFHLKIFSGHLLSLASHTWAHSHLVAHSLGPH